MEGEERTWRETKMKEGNENRKEKKGKVGKRKEKMEQKRKKRKILRDKKIEEGKQKEGDGEGKFKSSQATGPSPRIACYICLSIT